MGCGRRAGRETRRAGLAPVYVGKWVVNRRSGLGDRWASSSPSAYISAADRARQTSGSVGARDGESEQAPNQAQDEGEQKNGLVRALPTRARH